MSPECREVEPLLSPWLDGELDESRDRAVRAHLRSCPACAERAEELRQIQGAAAALAPHEPPADLWARVEARLAREEEPARPRWWWWLQAWRRPLLLGSAGLAAVAAAVILTVALRRPSPSAPQAAGLTRALHAIWQGARAHLPRPAVSEDDLMAAAIDEVSRAEGDLRAAVADLRQAVAVERPRWRPGVARAFDENLAAIDAAVERQREACRREPGNVAAQDALVASYRREIDFLQEMVVRGGLE
jgi:hypothetical protein